MNWRVVDDHSPAHLVQADFVAKKREMFLVQMSLDTKKAEIKKLEEAAKK